ncbi:helix-turn-helix domain-containing protein [Heliorestis convoluta]|uniref:Helix-turn-helix transcriptional regulator n=1 Tax=Heliorestis convoluta TaxID=356322 RepID=A0A5Q2MY77_9FIRM|nr:helix-turn-helix transcriptional regulator [Heliorestis convoluta]QGG47668.1 helix-turn-helix transcriptional regulator [Heliorestis convoluta]
MTNLEDRSKELLLLASAGQYLKELRLKKELSLAQLSKEVGVGAPYLSELERGLKSPSDHLIHQLADFYDLEEDVLFAKFGKIPIAARVVLGNEPMLLKTLVGIGKHKKIPEDKKQELYDYLHDLYKLLDDEKNS